ncbi:MAG TPA: VC0807 family protein [Streptosporangiaceae bacterium]|nr:VC0807 family protein [Streptosporangiaceae bacterium]
MPLAVDVAAPVALYYLLHGVGVHDSLALVLAGLIPGARTVVVLARGGKPDYLAWLMLGLFALSLGLLLITGSPSFLLAKECAGSAAIGLWCLASALSSRPMTYYTARPAITFGRPAAVAAWEDLGAHSPLFLRVQRRLSVMWGIGLIAEALARLAIIVHYPVHEAVGLVNIPVVAIVTALMIASGPAGGNTLRRLIRAHSSAAADSATHSATGSAAPAAHDTASSESLGTTANMATFMSRSWACARPVKWHAEMTVKDYQQRVVSSRQKVTPMSRGEYL